MRGGYSDPFPSGQERATSASSPRIMRSTSWAASSCPSPAVAQSCICARCARKYIREAFTRYKITYMAVCPCHSEKSRTRPARAFLRRFRPSSGASLHGLIGVNRSLTRQRPRLALSRKLLKDIHQAFGGELRALLVGGRIHRARHAAIFYDLGIQIYNGYGSTEACTAITLSGLRALSCRHRWQSRCRARKVRIVDPGQTASAKSAARSKTVMSHYLDDPALTSETIIDGWLMTGDLGKARIPPGICSSLAASGTLIVTAEGKNIYPEDIENVFEGPCPSRALHLRGELSLAAAHHAG